MRYIEVERFDATNNRYEYQQYVLDDNIPEDKISFLDELVWEFEEFIHEMNDPDYTEEEEDEYRDNCSWCWYELEENEYFGKEGVILCP